MLKSILRRGNRVALYVDGPNIMRKELDVDLDGLREQVETHGRIVEAKVFLNQFTPQKVIEAVSNQGWEPVVAMAGASREEKSDVDALMGAVVMEGALNDSIDTIVVVTRDADFAPVILKAKSRGKKTVVMGTDPGFSTALQNAADEVEVLPSRD